MDEKLFLQGIGLGGPDNPPPADPMTAAKNALQQAAADKVASTRLKTKVAGVDVSLGRDGLDVGIEKAAGKAVEKAKSQVVGWVLGCAFTALLLGMVFVIVVAIGIYIWTRWTPS